MDIDQIKHTWQSADPKGKRFDDMTREAINEAKSHRTTKSLRRVCRQLRMAVIIACVSPFLLFLLMSGFELPLLFIILFPLYFVVLGLMNGYLLVRFSHFEPWALSSRDAIVKFAGLCARRRIVQVVSIALMIPMVVYMFFVLGVSRDILVGMSVGLAVGLLVGILKWIKMSAELRRVRQSIERDIQD